MVAPIIAVIVLMAAASPVAVSSVGVSPGNPLYGLTETGDDMRVFLSLDKKAKKTEIFEEKVDRYVRLVEEGRPRDAAVALATYEAALTRLSEEEGEDVQEVIRRNTEMLTELLLTDPGNTGLQEAITSSDNAQATVELNTVDYERGLSDGKITELLGVINNWGTAQRLMERYEGNATMIRLVDEEGDTIQTREFRIRNGRAEMCQGCSDPDAPFIINVDKVDGNKIIRHIEDRDELRLMLDAADYFDTSLTRIQEIVG